MPSGDDPAVSFGSDLWGDHMKLSDVAAAPGGIPMEQLFSDDELKRELQQRLSDLGCLDPPPDGNFGPVSQLVLRRVAGITGAGFDGETLDSSLAQALLDHNAASLIPLQLDGGLAARVVRYLEIAGWWFCRLPGFHNIIYVEGVDLDGTVNSDRMDQFNDVRLVITVEGDRPVIRHQALATTEPGRFYTDNPLNHRGAARIAFGQYKSWHVGTHKPSSPSGHEALVQARDVQVFRDLDRNGIRTGDALFTGVFGINQHSGHDAPVGSIGKASAGCLVARTTQDHRAFMDLVKTDERFGVNRGYLFLTTIINGDELARHVP